MRPKPGARGRRGRETSRWRRLRWAFAGWGALGLLVAAGLAAPRLADGYAALQWTRHYAAGGGGERPAERARQAGRWAARTVDLLAPLPQAAEAAALALQVGVVLEGEHPSAALALYPQVRAALERQRASRWRGVGLARLTQEARAREQAVGRAAGGSGAPRGVTAPGVRPTDAASPSAVRSPDRGLATPTSPSLPATGASPSPEPSVSPASSPSPPAVVGSPGSPQPTPKPPRPRPSRRAKAWPRPTGARG